MKRALKGALLVTVLQGSLAVGLCWVGEEWLTQKTWALDPRATTTAAEQLADLYAAAASRFVLTGDQTALAHLVRRAARWPEIVYVDVEDAQGRVLAHTDPARVGTIWSEAMSTKIRSTAGAAHREIAVPMLDPAQKDGPPVGQVRLGYITTNEATSVPLMSSRPSVVLVLMIAVATAVPFGAFVVVLVKPLPQRPVELLSQPLENLAQVARADRERLMADIRRLKVALSVREAEVARLTKVPPQITQARTIDPSPQRAIVSIAHAVRSSLTNILGFSKLLLRELDGPLTETQTADLLNIQRAGEELLTFVTALSELSRAEAGQVQLRPEPVDANVLLRELAAECGSAHSLDMQVECPAELPLVRVDRTHLVQILHALIMQSTALSGPGHGAVVLRPQKNGTTVQIAVAHPGRIIAKEDLETVFDPFASSEMTGGRVGLALARSLAILNGGSLAVECQPQYGVVFALTVPLERQSQGGGE